MRAGFRSISCGMQSKPLFHIDIAFEPVSGSSPDWPLVDAQVDISEHDCLSKQGFIFMINLSLALLEN